MTTNSESLFVQIFGASVDFGIGSLSRLPIHISKLNISCLLIVTDKGIVKAGILDKVLSLLNDSGTKHSVFDDVQPNPTDANVMEGLKAYIGNACDGIIGLGGGSSLDAAKAIGVLATNSGHISQYYSPAEIQNKISPIIAIPTTSGTGSEVSSGSLITDTSQNRKRVIRSGPASIALVDPELTINMPPYLTAATGIDALSHCIEGYVGKRYNPFASAIAIEGIKIASANLRRAVKDGSDIEARKNMSMASTMGALAFTKGLGVIHSLSHQLSTDSDIPHGVANAIMLPYGMQFNIEQATHEYSEIAIAMGVDTHGMSPEEAAKIAIEAVRQLTKDIGLPDNLRDAGAKEESLVSMSKKAMEDHCHILNPRSCTEEDMLALYKAAYSSFQS